MKKRLSSKGNVSDGIPWVMPLGFGNKRKRNWKKNEKKKELDQLPTFAWVESAPTLVGWLLWENN